MKELRGTTETSSGAMLLYGKRARIGGGFLALCTVASIETVVELVGRLVVVVEVVVLVGAAVVR